MELIRTAAALAVAVIVGSGSAPRAQTPTPAASEPAYLTRGHETEAHQHAYHERLERAHRALSKVVGEAAPDLLPTLTPPPPEIYGYQLLPTIGDDAPLPAAGTKAQVVSFSWQWSDTRIERETRKIDEL